MQQCDSCGGFLPRQVMACPHCALGRCARNDVPARSPLRRALEVAGGGAIAFTLMACYGAPAAYGPHAPVDPVTNDCGTRADDIDADGWCDADCDEVNPDVFPGAPDPPGDGLDQNCDGADGEAGSALEPSSDVQMIAR